MIHARIESSINRRVAGYECGTRAQFDARYGGDPLWVFLDTPIMRYRVKLSDFIIAPHHFYLDTDNTPRRLRQIDQLYSYVIEGSTGAFLTDADGTLLIDDSPLKLSSFFVDSDGVLWIDDAAAQWVLPKR